MMKYSHIIVVAILVVITNVFSGCYYDVEEELYPGNGNCDTTNVTYSLNIKSILSSNCIVCHNQSDSQGNVNLDNYDDLKDYVDSGALLGSIKHEAGYSPMPNDGTMLSDCNIRIIENWIVNGSLNN